MEKDKRLRKLPDGRDPVRGKLSLVLMGWAMLSKSLIQFSVGGGSCVPSLLFDLRPNCGGGDEGNGTSFQRSQDALLHSAPHLPQAAADPHLHWRLLDTQGKSGCVACVVNAPFSWIMVHTGFCCAFQVSLSQPV